MLTLDTAAPRVVDWCEVHEVTGYGNYCALVDVGAVRPGDCLMQQMRLVPVLPAAAAALPVSRD